MGRNKIKVIVNNSHNKSLKSDKSNTNKNPNSRWNQLTVYEHLYLNSHKR